MAFVTQKSWLCLIALLCCVVSFVAADVDMIKRNKIDLHTAENEVLFVAL